MAQRLKEITYLRAFAALSIVLIHATSGYINTGLVGVALNQLGRYGSPIFIIMSGFILYHIELKRPSPSYVHFFKHRFLKVAVPYLIWSIIYSTYTFVTKPSGLEVVNGSSILKTLLLNIVTGQGYVHLYFILIMIQLYALFPFLKKAVERYTYITLAAVALISLFFQSVISLNVLKIITLPSIGFPYVALFPGWLFFFCFGIYLKTSLEQTWAFLRKRKLLLFLIWICLLVTIVFEAWNTPLNFTLRPTVSLYGITSFFLFYLVFENLKNTIPKVVDQLIEWVANNSLHVYLVHPLILNLLVIPSKWAGYHGIAGLYVAAVFFTCLSIYVLNIIKGLVRSLSERHNNPLRA